MENYDWIPPGLDREEIEEFFQNFSKNKIPLIGSTGEINRKKVLFRQIPKHDMEYEFCEHLKTKKSVGDFFKYAFDRNLKALDIGLAMKNTLKRLVGFLIVTKERFLIFNFFFDRSVKNVKHQYQ